MGWWASKIRRFWLYFFGRVSPAERATLNWLTSDQLRLFDSMHRADQRHGLDVVAALKAGGQTDPDLLMAGLLHDCGKGRSLHLWHRVGWSLSERYGSGIERIFLRVPGFKSAFATLAVHAERSAELALMAGCSGVTVDLIHHQAKPVDQVLGKALLIADQAN